MPPLTLRGDECLAAYLLDYGENNRRSALHVELIKKDIGENDVESCTKEIEQPLVDNYFDRSYPTPNHSQEELMTGNYINPFDYLLEHSDQQNQLISEDTFSFTNGSNLAIGQEFKNKDEVKFTLKDITMKACFEMKIAKSTKSLYVTKCIDKSCKWAVRVAKVSNSECFSIRTYCTCTLAPLSVERESIVKKVQK
ncbi:hypothetical protein F8388_000635 [Cannabis sativa]|uniref:Transposase MuDR plant domain-containing protein n=1 Tax=Cannabis sativa TaxID=3483 RepID=A0A7J6EFM6_CANSA|nr:hypothetical protein G4B88_030403 [Cannabis sativa]KAF4381941.1 hypothetical protein F8388_000635 [Cannabis sativa]